MTESPSRAQLARVLALVPYLLANPGASPEDVCRAFDLDRETLDSDLDLIWMCGVPPYDPFALIDVERDGSRISISSAEYFTRPVSLTLAEARALRSALSILGEAGDEAGALARVMAKVDAAVGAPDEAVPIGFAPEPGASASVFRSLKEAADRRTSARIVYYSPSRGCTSERMIDPYHLLKVAGQWYALAHCHDADATRLFRLDRVESAQATDSPFPDRTEPDAGMYASGVLYTPSRRDRIAKVRFEPVVARWAAETWPREPTERGADGSVAISIPYSSEQWLVRQILPYGPHAKILDPPELARAFAETATALLRRYNSSAGDAGGARVE